MSYFISYIFCQSLQNIYIYCNYREHYFISYLTKVRNIDINSSYSIHRILVSRWSYLDFYPNMKKVLMLPPYSLQAFLLCFSIILLETTPITKGIVSHHCWYHTSQIERIFLSSLFPMILFSYFFFFSLGSSAICTSLIKCFYFPSWS